MAKHNHLLNISVALDIWFGTGINRLWIRLVIEPSNKYKNCFF